jgi:hypothetical protein
MPSPYIQELHYRKRPFLLKNGSSHHALSLYFQLQGYVSLDEQFMQVTEISINPQN